MQTSKVTGTLILFLGGLLPVLAVTAAYLININQTGVSSCIPFFSGCISISRAVRSGPGLLLFNTLMLPAAVMLAVSWVHICNWAREHKLASDRTLRIVLWLGATGTAFMALYIINLGLDGTVYRFMRRFGVSIFFGFTAINHLLLVRMLLPVRSRLSFEARKFATWFVFIVSLEWLVGVVTVGKRLFVSNPEMLDQLESIFEWWFALFLMGAFMLLARLLSSINSAEDWSSAES